MRRRERAGVEKSLKRENKGDGIMLRLFYCYHVLFYPASSAHKLSKEDSVLRVHPNFRMIVLANRPGFPFLGNDFFAAVGERVRMKK